MNPKLTAEERIKLIERALKGEPVAKLCREAGISRVIFYRWLKRYKKDGQEGVQAGVGGRPTKKTQLVPISSEYPKLSPNARLKMVEEVVVQGSNATEVAEKYGVSRVTLYKWINRYQKAKKEGEEPALVAKKPEIVRYWRQTPEKHEESVLSLVAQHPEYGIRKLLTNLPKVAGKPIVGHHGVQNILRRHNLNTYELRAAYAQEQITPFTRTVGTAVEQITRFFGIAPEARSKIIRSTGIFALSAFVTIVVFGLGGYISRSLVDIGGVSKIGFFFATVALVMGSIFFAYSLKYYLSLAIVLSFSQQEGAIQNRNGNGIRRKRRGGFFSWLLGLASNGNGNGKLGHKGPIGLEPNLEHISLKKKPYVSIHIPFYNEKNVVERAMEAATNFDYPEYEVILCDDSTDETVDMIRRYQKQHLAKGQRLKTVVNKREGWELTTVEVKPGVTFKHLHRTSRSGFKGGALRLALTMVDPRTEFISVFDADFVPYPDTLQLFLKYFKVQNNMSEDYKQSNVAAVQGYQWHVLNKSENWITRGVRSEYAGSYVIERPGREIYGALKQISGAVYMIRRDALEEAGWATSITEDFELTLKLYNRGYKVVFTPYIQAPAECVSTLKRLIRQRMRWAEGHSSNVRKMFTSLMFNKKLTFTEKVEFLYLSPYYLQAFFFLIGTISWLLSETVFPARLPFWTSLWGWSLVLTNFFSLPLVNAVGLFLEESEERDYLGLASFIALSYILVPFQAYSSIKGFLQKEEGPWFRTPKTGKITDVFTRGKFYRFISGIIPGRAPAAASIGRGEPALAPVNLNKYVALATANNQFNSFNVKSRKTKWLGKVVLSFLLAFSVTVYSYTKGVPEVLATPINTLWLHDDNPSTSGVITAVTTAWQLVGSADTTDSISTVVSVSKSGPAGRGTRYPPGSTGSAAVNMGADCTNGNAAPTVGGGEGWIYDTAFEASPDGSIAAGTWTFYINEIDTNDIAVGYILACPYIVTISSGGINTYDLINESGSDTTGITIGTDTWDAGVNDISGFKDLDSVSFTGNQYLYVEYWNYFTGRPDVNATSTFRTGPGYSNPRITTPNLVVPERVLIFLFVSPFLPFLVNKWMRKKKEKFELAL